MLRFPALLASSLSIMNRQLTSAEEQLIRWMLEHGNSEAQAFLPQLDNAEVTPYRCPCGCASVNLSIDGATEPSGTFRILADFIFGTDDDLSGIFAFEKGGVLAGLEVYGLASDAPKSLPPIESLRLFSK
jgi:hypothetical protein